MKVGIVDADLLDHGTRHPNLALMKVSGYLQAHGHETKLLLDNDLANYKTYRDVLSEYDKIVLSRVFDFSKLPEVFSKVLTNQNVMRQGAEHADYMYKTHGPKIVYGGTGFIPSLGGKLPNHLPNEIEHQQLPDYHLYDEFVKRQIEVFNKKSIHYKDYRDFSIGFSTRGCFRRCKFCVNRGYNYVKAWSPIHEFHDRSRPYIYLWDDNFLGLKNHAEPILGDPYRSGYVNTWDGILDDLERTKKPFQFRQGLDIRLMDDEIAERLSTCRYYGDFIFAFDHPEQKDWIVKGLKIWKRYNPKNVPKFYVLCGFDNQDERDIATTFERIRILMQFGCLPYIMRHLKYLKSRYAGLYVQLARWCNQPQFFKKKSFREFCEANQYYHEIGPHRLSECASYRAMKLFEQEHQNIAKQYFDMKWDDLRGEWKEVYGV